MQLLSEELNETNGIYSIKDPFYADYLICELNRSHVMRRFYFERVVDHFCRFAASDEGCPRHFVTVNEILENVTVEELDHFLAQYYVKHEYLESMINMMGYSYLMKCMERYYVQSLGYAHLLANTPENRYQIRRILKKMPTPQNEIGLIRKLFMLVPLGFRNKHAAAFSYIAYLMKCNGFDQRQKLPIVTAFYSVVSNYPADQYKQHSVCFKLDNRCSYQRDKTTVYLDVLYTCGADDRVYAYNLSSGECETVIQLQKGDEGLCLFYFDTKIFIVGRRLIYLWDTVHNIKAVFDYVKNMQSEVKDASVSKNGDVVFWFENGLIKLYRRMQPLFEIDCFVGSNIEHVWTKEIDGNMITVVLVKGQGYYIFKNERELFFFGSDIKNELRSEKYAGVNGDNFYYAISHEEYATLNLINFDNRATPLTIQGVLILERENVITAVEYARITVNGDFTGLNHGVTYTELVDGSLYLIDNEGNLRIC